MKFDTIIIGGGLSGLCCGISLAQAGKKVAIAATGQSSLHFFSGSFDMLGYDIQEKEVEHPLEAIAQLPDSHPYRKLDNETLIETATAFSQLLAGAGINVKGSYMANHYRLTPTGLLEPTWLTLEGMAMIDSAGQLKTHKVLLAYPKEFMDLPVDFMEANLKQQGVEVMVKELEDQVFSFRRKSPSEMRATNLAKVLIDENAMSSFAQELNNLGKDNNVDTILLPNIIGWGTSDEFKTLQSKVSKPIRMVATLPPSVCGISVQAKLKQRFEKLGGTFLIGDRVIKGNIQYNRVTDVSTEKLTDEILQANEFVVASGSFRSQGIIANYERVYEPIFDLDIDYTSQRESWYDANVFAAQPYMQFGVKTDGSFRAYKNGVVLENVYAVGSILSGNNSIRLADGTGVDAVTGTAVANIILKK